MKKNDSIRPNILLILLACLCIAAIITGGYFYYNYEKKNIEKEKYNDLKSLADLKESQIVTWLNNRKSELLFLSNDEHINELAFNLLTIRDSQYFRSISRYVSLFNFNRHYNNIYILSADKKQVITITSEDAQLPDTEIHFPEFGLLPVDSCFTDLFYCPYHNRVHFDFITPLNFRSEQTGYIVFRVAPESVLYPLIKQWPVPGKSAETLLVKPEQDSILFLNELRHRSSTAMKFRLPAKDSVLPAAQAVNGRIGFFKGFDYRKHKVISDLRKIPGTNWYLISKIDVSEVYSGLPKMTEIIVSFGIIILLMVIIFTSWIYHFRQKQIYQRLTETQSDLKQSKTEYLTILYSIGDGVITTGLNGKIQLMNQIAEQLTGWKENEAIDKPLEEVFNIVYESDHSDALERIDKIKKGLAPDINDSILLKSKNGKETPVSDRVSVIKNEKGQILGVILIFRDQSIEHQAEIKIRESELRFRGIFEDSPIGKSITGMDGTLTVNKEFCRMLGYSEDELQTIHWKKITHPDDIADNERLVDELKSGKIKNIRFEKRYIHKDGHIVWTDLNSAIYYDSNKNPLFFITSVVDITEKKQAEQELKEQQLLLNEMGFIAKIGGWEFDPVTGKGTWTDEVARIHGLDPEKETGVQIGLSFYEGRSKTKIETAIKEAIENGKPYKLDLELTDYNGEKKWVQTIGSPVIHKGKVVKVRGSFQDITEHKIMVDEIKRNEERFRSTLDNMMEGCQIIGFDWEYIYLNHAAEIHNKRSNSELLGNKYADMWPGIEKTKIYDIIKDCLENRNSHQLENYFVYPDGSDGWFDLGIQPITEGVFILSIDITERKKVEIAHRESEERFTLFFNESPIPACISRLKDSKITNVNAAWCTFMGYNHDDVVGFSAEELGILDKSTREKIMNIVFQKGYIKNFETIVKTKNSTRNILSSLELISIGGEVYIINMIVDITEQKQAEAAIQNINKELETRVDERTSQLLAANKELESFAYSVSHDLRAPLRGIHGFTQILIEDYSDKLDDEGKRVCSVIQKNSKKMGRLIDEILTFSRLNRSEMHKAEVDMKLLIQSVFNELTTPEDRKKIRLNIKEIHNSLCDHTLIKQVWANLISNAIKFSSKQDKPVIEISSTIEDNKIIYHIKDNGVGFDMKYVNKLFGVFQRLHSDNEFQGTGVGLAIVQRIVQRHGGRIRAEGAINKGASFYFSLPIINNQVK